MPKGRVIAHIRDGALIPGAPGDLNFASLRDLMFDPKLTERRFEIPFPQSLVNEGPFLVDQDPVGDLRIRLRGETDRCKECGQPLPRSQRR